MRSLKDEEVLQLAARIWPGQRGQALAGWQGDVLRSVVAYINELISAVANTSPVPALPEATDPTVAEALAGNRGHGQQVIAKTGLDWLLLLLKKNADYGSTVFSAPSLIPTLTPKLAILVRMSDKLSRMTSLLSKSDTGPEVASESLHDTIQDLGAYCLLYLCSDQINELREPTSNVPA